MALNNVNQEQLRTREEFKKEKSQVKQNRDKQTNNAEISELPNKRIRIRLIPIWLRLILLIVFMFVSIVAGAVVGYSVLGGGKAADVFKESTWTHIIDLVNKEK
ncbi:DNA-directed RNA polymerase subunit beta [Neobacillus sp. OS1-32]|jgi:hypothetical protein|uniref:DNA-directed RNA polymerase subunit beta n=1 Tax=Neobacillus paridis TaxID=2803862 RepID=A0ABS1TUY5_9BACI|nr:MULTISPECIES: DNA-directed RNA polymerase subunit beta [Neobacillus]MBL4955119.1 DNA-directed RNA polymerase subunit beta [Neobacillus paridis]WML29372.1 DNA-directed RNA polymerase subunit beta [Neobacillus sp. OS1-32]